MGSTPHAHAQANVPTPHDQGVVAMIGVFIDTFVVLTLNALVIISTLYTPDGILAAGYTGNEVNAAGEAIAKANLYISATWHTQSATYWAKEEGDTAKGYEKNGEGEWYRPEYRWGIKVNGTVAELNEAEHKSPESGEVSTQMMPTEFALNEGINKIDLYTYGGYRAKMTNMKIIGK
jgi:hypothetical protein